MKKTMKEIVEEYNSLSDNPVKKFATIKTGELRLAELKANNVPKEAETPVEEPQVVSEKPAAPKPRRWSATGAVAAMKLLHDLKTDNPELTRKEYIAICEKCSIKSSTAGAQWHYVKNAKNWSQLEKDLAGRF